MSLGSIFQPQVEKFSTVGHVGIPIEKFVEWMKKQNSLPCA